MLKFEALEKLERGDRRKLRNLALVLAVLLGVVILAGCQYAAPQVAGAVDTYCSATNAEDQAALRQRFDAETDPHKIRILCNEKPEKTGGKTDG